MKKISVVFICFLILLAYTNTAFATSCAYIQLPKEELKQADVVFKGELTLNQNHRLQFDVEKVWAGDSVEDSISIEDNIWIEPVLGNEYIIFAESKRGKLSPMGCGNSGFATEGLELILDEELMEHNESYIYFLSIGIIVVLVGIFLYWILKRLRETE
ncbi:hypothetical protein [Bacillus alkalicellulosilyticus]|uniref:hypothetical protein n=1 Tax=Alkalihalobacterium alkalicellulosilyticum TaxID=1912214 RepID=UPI0009986EE5|nr:hypothetical protein [Bacillus alkalicellulosilyticus]